MTVSQKNQLLMGWQTQSVWHPWSKLEPWTCELWLSRGYRIPGRVFRCRSCVNRDVLKWKTQAVGEDKHSGPYCCSCRVQVSLLIPRTVPLGWSYLTWCNWHWPACWGHEGPEVEAGCTYWEQGQGPRCSTGYENPLCRLGLWSAGCTAVLSQGCMHQVQVCGTALLGTREQ